MSKLWKLKDWVTLPDAAGHLTAVLGEPVREADILRLSLDGHLRLSVNFVNRADGRRGFMKTEEEAEYLVLEGDSLAEFKRKLTGNVGVPDKIDILKIPMGVRISDGRILQMDDEVQSLEGVFDLAMIGAERLDIEDRFHMLSGGPKVSLVNIDGVFVTGQEGVMFQIMEEFEDSNRPRRHIDNFFPAGRVPRDALLVVRTKALKEFISNLTEESAEDIEGKARREIDVLGSIHPRAETTYLNIIGALLEFILNPRPGRESAAAVIGELVLNYGDKPGISKTTLEAKFAEAKRSLLAE